MPTLSIANGTKTLGTPSSGDTLFVLGGNQYINTNIDQSGLANGLVTVRVFAAFRGQFASAAAPFYSEITTSFINEAEAGDVYYKGKDTTDATPLIQHKGGGHFHFIDGTATIYEVSNGQSTIEDGAIVTTYRQSGGIGSILNAGSATVPTNLYMDAGPSGVGGRCYTERCPTNGYNKAGELTINGTGNMTALVCDGPAAVAKTIIQNVGTITTLTALGHIPDLTRLENLVTITNAEINMSLPGAAALLANPKITFTNTPTRRYSGGEPY